MTTLPDLSFLDDDVCRAEPPPGPTPADLTVDWFVLWDERAAIMEFDGGLLREKAELLALLEVLAAMARAGDFGA